MGCSHHDDRGDAMLMLNALILLVVMLVAKWLTGLFVFVVLAVLAFVGVVVVVVGNRGKKV
jgi:Flp pilus assembly protein TadB